jgi:hypothetical protein
MMSFNKTYSKHKKHKLPKHYIPKKNLISLKEKEKNVNLDNSTNVDLSLW